MKTCIKLRHEWRGPHVHVDVFAGEDGGTLALAGRLVFSREEWDKIATCLATASERTSDGSDIALVLEKSA